MKSIGTYSKSEQSRFRQDFVFMQRRQCLHFMQAQNMDVDEDLVHNLDLWLCMIGQHGGFCIYGMSYKISCTGQIV